jgi:hypothetical protein
VQSIMSLGTEILRQGFWELVINQEFHADCRTMCSV